MKIYSWNMLYRNRELARAFDFIAHADFDVFCLQEVPEEMLARLRELPMHIATAEESDRKSGTGKQSTLYSVILSRYPIRASAKVPLPYRASGLPLRGKLLIELMSSLRLWTKIVGNRHALYADLETPEGVVRVFNVHLILLHPAVRLQEFEMIMTARDPSLPTIVCGDFNIVESPRVSLLNWLFGGRVSDAIFYKRERAHIEKHFVEHELVNALRGKATHSLSRSQLDHILVSRSFSIKNATVLLDRVGSDHHPIFAEIS